MNTQDFERILDTEVKRYSNCYGNMNDFLDLMNAFKDGHIGHKKFYQAIKQAAMQLLKEGCERQRELCLENAKIRIQMPWELLSVMEDEVQYEDNHTFKNGVSVKISADSILIDTPLAVDLPPGPVKTDTANSSNFSSSSKNRCCGRCLPGQDECVVDME